MLRLIGRWSLRAIAALLLLFLVVYGGDLAIYKLRGSPVGKVTVDRYVSVPLKGKRTEYDYIGSFDTPCAEALFPQNSMDPCWKLRRNPNQGMDL